MPWSADEYEQAKDVASRMDDPKRKAALEQGIMRFEQDQSRRLGNDPKAAGLTDGQGSKLRAKAASQRAVNPQLSPFGLTLGGPTGMDALASNPKFTEGRPEEPLETGFRRVQTPDGAGAYTSAPTRGGKPVKLTPGTTVGDKSYAPGEALPDNGIELPSASKDAKVYRPPEFIPKEVPFKVAMGARVEFEPSVNEFRAATGKQLGPKVMMLDESSPEYKLYADAVWQQKYDAAEKAGVPLTRKAYMNSDDWQAKVAKGLVSWRDGEEALVSGIGSGMSGGIIPEAAAFAAEKTGLQPNAVSELRAQSERNPVENVAGNLVGAATPASLASKATALGKGALGPATSLAGRLGRAGLVGAGVGALEGTTSAGAQAASDKLRGDQSGSPSVGAGALAGAALGGAGGVVGEGLGSLASKAVGALRSGRLAQELGQAEAAGAKTGTIRGIKPPEGIQANLDAPKLNEFEAAPIDYAADKVKIPMAHAASEHDAALKKTLEAENASYNNSVEGQAEHPVRNLVSKLGEIIKRKTSDGKPLPMVQTAEFARARDAAYVPKLVDATLGRQAAEESGGFVMSLRDAHASGLPVPKTEGDLVGKVLVMEPRRLNAQQLDEVEAGIDAAAGLTQQATKSKDPAFDELARAIRRDRDQFAPNAITGFETRRLPDGTEITGLSAMKANHSERIRGKEELFKRAGLPSSLKEGGWEQMNPDDKIGFERALKASGTRGIEGQSALRRLAEMADVGDQLKEIAGTRAVQALKSSGDRALPYASTSALRHAAGLVVPGMSLHADPAMRAMAFSADELSPSLVSLLRRMRRGVTAGGPDELRRAAGLPGGYAINSRPPAVPEGPLSLRDAAGALREGINSSSSMSFGLRGGGLGGRAAQAAGSNNKHGAREQLTPEDKQNLIRLIQAQQGAQ